MDNYDINKFSDDQIELIEALSRESAIGILLQLCEDKSLKTNIITMAKTALSDVDADEIAERVFRSLNSIEIEDLWDNSGKSYGGYNDPTDVAFDMLNDEVYFYKKKMEQYRELDMKYEEKEYCKGIVSGLLTFAQKGNSEFRDAVPDDPYTIADNIIYDWKKHNTAEDFNELKSVHDSFFEN